MKTINVLCESRDAVDLLLKEKLLLGLSDEQIKSLGEISDQTEVILFEYEDKHI